ncbi:MAG: Trk system potassium transporter TrkA [Ruminococcus sp.]|nr:Trk system potassium transporter TrkA [Candidatus Copronaster equi]
MKIIVVGIGKVGSTVAEQLSNEMHDVTVVDINSKVLENTVSELDVFAVLGNGASKKVLVEAGVNECDLLIALTGSDEVNLLCCLIANKLGANGTIARVRNPVYNEDIRLYKDNLGLSMAINPEREAAEEILRILKFPSAKNIETFAKGKINMVSFVADRRCNLCGKPVKESFAKEKALACAIERGNNIFIPFGDTVIEENDVVAVLIPPDEIPDFFKGIGLRVNSVKSTMIIGGGKIAHYLAVEMARLNMKTTIIEINEKKAEELSYLLPNANVICGDGTNRSLLMEEGFADASAICCLTGIDEENILLSLFAKKVDPTIKTISKVNRTAFYEVIRSLDIDSIIYPKYITASQILQHVRAKQNNIGSNVETLYKIIDNKVEALEFNVSEDSQLVGMTLESVEIKKNILIGSINRKGKVFIPHGKDTLEVGDSVIVVTTKSGLSDLDDIKA